VRPYVEVVPLIFNPPPGWPTPPEGWQPSPGWQPDPTWPLAPPAWSFFIESGDPARDFDLLVEPISAPAARAWYWRKRVLIPAGVVVLLAVAGALPDQKAPVPIPVAGSTVSSRSSPPKGAPATRPAGRPTVQPTTPVARRTDQSRPTALAATTPVRGKAPVKRPVVVRSTPKKVTRHCDPNYSGACVPVASDVDCAGGSGNGPAFFGGVATVVGVDIYQLDRDRDGLACEPN
jgi:hypothetical protein